MRSMPVSVLPDVLRVASCSLLLAALLVPAGCTKPRPARPAVHGGRFMTGVFLPGEHLAGRYDGYVQRTRSRPSLLLTFVPWAPDGGPSFPANFCRFAREHGATPIVTWEPWEPVSGWHPLLADIAAGRQDDRIRDWAAAARQWKQKVLLRFAHEMNGDWYPWSERKDPRQTADDYVAAWRRIRELYRQAGADNVEFVWAINCEPADDLGRFYPGDDEVEWIGIDLYNRAPWARDPLDLLASGLAFAQDRGKPVLLTEVGCAEAPASSSSQPAGRASPWSDKPRWIARFFDVIVHERSIHGFVWFEVAKEADWRVGSSSGALTAFRRGLLSLDSQDVMKP